MTDPSKTHALDDDALFRELRRAQRAIHLVVSQEDGAESISGLFKRAADRLTVSPPVPEGWRPIETAPKDGTGVILCDAVGPAYEGYWERDSMHEGWYFANSHWTDATECQGYPVVWMPLPPPPAATQGQEG